MPRERHWDCADIMSLVISLLMISASVDEGVVSSLSRRWNIVWSVQYLCSSSMHFVLDGILIGGGVGSM